MKKHIVYLYTLICSMSLNISAQHTFSEGHGEIITFVERAINIGPRSVTLVGKIKHISEGDVGIDFVFFDFNSRSVDAFGHDSEIALRLRRPYDGWDEVTFETDISDLEPDTEYRPQLYAGNSLFLTPPALSKPFGFRTLPEGWKPTNKWQEGLLEEPEVPTYSSLPELRPETRNVVVVTHGYQPTFRPVDIAWIDEMVNVINTYFLENGMSEWQAVSYKWVEKANIPVRDGGPRTALQNAVSEGIILGRTLRNRSLDHVHLIAHSAGSGLIQSTCTTLKQTDTKEDSPETIVHLTFLDPFIGATSIDSYGTHADWSDNYFSRESLLGTGVFTQPLLFNAYNVDVTFLDSNKRVQRFTNYTVGGMPGEGHECITTVSSHRWPVNFYHQTIVSSSFREAADGYGFGLSLEGGSWETALSLEEGNRSVRVLGEPDPPCDPPPSSSTPAVLMPVFTAPESKQIPSETGLIERINDVLQLTTGSPAWVATTLSMPNSVDRVSFEAAFTDTSSDGLLSIYWDNERLGAVDQRASLPGNNEYTFLLPERATEGVLSFRLDPLSESTAQVQVDNPVLHEVPVSHFFEVNLAGFDQDERPILQIVGAIGSVYTIVTSRDLIDWQAIAVIESTEKEVLFTDTQSEQSDTRFYQVSLF